MIAIDKNSYFWKYLSAGQRGLIEEGLYLLQDLKIHPDTNITDYSYLVFPFAKAYEGFLKKLFLDLHFITEAEYGSNHFRIGKALNPHLEKYLRHESVYDKVILHCGGRYLAEEMWSVWKNARNLVFHYFPHNLRALTFEEAQSAIESIMMVMEKATAECRLEEKL